MGSMADIEAKAVQQFYADIEKIIATGQGPQKIGEPMYLQFLHLVKSFYRLQDYSANQDKEYAHFKNTLSKDATYNDLLIAAGRLKKAADDKEWREMKGSIGCLIPLMVMLSTGSGLVYLVVVFLSPR